MLGYTNDNGGRLPPYSGWQSAITPYVPRDLVAHIQEYSYSQSVAGKKLDSINGWTNAELLKSNAPGSDGRYVVVYLDGRSDRN